MQYCSTHAGLSPTQAMMGSYKIWVSQKLDILAESGGAWEEDVVELNRQLEVLLGAGDITKKMMKTDFLDLKILMEGESKAGRFSNFLIQLWEEKISPNLVDGDPTAIIKNDVIIETQAKKKLAVEAIEAFNKGVEKSFESGRINEDSEDNKGNEEEGGSEKTTIGWKSNLNPVDIPRRIQREMEKQEKRLTQMEVVLGMDYEGKKGGGKKSHFIPISQQIEDIKQRIQAESKGRKNADTGVQTSGSQSNSNYLK